MKVSEHGAFISRKMKCNQLLQRSLARIRTSQLRMDATAQLVQSHTKPTPPHALSVSGYRVHIVQDPSATLERVNSELWMYAASPGDHQFAGWFMYFEGNEGEISQLWGPFAEREHAQLYARAYYWTLPQRFQRCGSVFILDQAASADCMDRSADGSNM